VPAMPSAAEIRARGIKNCRRVKVHCIDLEIQRMERAQRELHCDHRAVFATTYLELTRQLREELSTAFKKRLIDRKYLYVEDALFANVYFATLKTDKRGQPIPEAWRIAIDTARSGQVNGGQDMLLGINAHVQNDMPFVLAALGLVTPSGASRKPDHDIINEVLERAYERVVAAVANRYDPLVAVTNSPANPGDNVAGLELVKQWREDVWTNAQKLVDAKSAGERDAVADGIKANAADWARGISAGQTPGDRARRDAYCAEKLGP
jgi:uncharacterized protein DUF5995